MSEKLWVRCLTVMTLGDVCGGGLQALLAPKKVQQPAAITQGIVSGVGRTIQLLGGNAVCSPCRGTSWLVQLSQQQCIGVGS